MEEPAVADEPQLGVTTGDNVGDRADEPAVLVVAIMRELSRRGIPPVKSAALHAQPELASEIPGDGVDIGTAEDLTVARIVKIPDDALAARVEAVQSFVRRNPQQP